jgi:hypothetical protein
MNATLKKIVNDQDLWNEHVDPQGAEPESFDKMTLVERIMSVMTMFPADMTDVDREYAFKNLYEATEALCKTDAEGESSLHDWMREGSWWDATPADMAAEWDALEWNK